MNLSSIWDFISDHCFEVAAGVVFLVGVGLASKRGEVMPEPEKKDSDGFSIVYATVPSMDVAKEISNTILQQNDAACINIFPKVTSMFNWGGGIDVSEEVVLIIKTVKKQFKKINATIVAKHPYSIPAILEIPVDNGNTKFLSWVMNTVAASTSGD
ncbi:Divalent-cation tolerance protein CutA [Trichinella pseudospiralis]